MTIYTVMGPAGAPMRPPFGSFAGKPTANTSKIYTVMGPAGAPFMPPYGLGHTSNPFGGKTGGGAKFFTVSGLAVSNNNPAFVFTGGVSYTWSAMSQRTK